MRAFPQDSFKDDVGDYFQQSFSATESDCLTADVVRLKLHKPDLHEPSCVAVPAISFLPADGAVWSAGALLAPTRNPPCR
jgi:hypothetical protein